MPRTRFLLAAVLILAAAPAYADVKAGVDLWEHGDYPGAIREWRPRAITGDPDAQFNLGQAYKLGRGVPADSRLAEDWFRKAALQGHVQAQDNYGLIMFQNGNRAGAMPHIEESAGRGDPRAQYVFGTALFNGDLVKKDWVRAYALMTRASAAGIPAASASLAQMDKFIPIDQRQRGLALARAFEAAAARLQMADAPRPIVVAEKLPPSKPVTAPKPAPAKPVVAKAPPTPSGNWRVQLAAFSDSSKAAGLWSGLHRRIAALGPYRSYTSNAGAFTRLQAGPLASRAAADKLCASVKAAGQACIPVAP